MAWIKIIAANSGSGQRGKLSASFRLRTPSPTYLATRSG